MSEMIAIIVLVVLLSLVCVFVWAAIGFSILMPRTSRLCKMRTMESVWQSAYELTFWPIVLYKLRKFEACDG